MSHHKSIIFSFIAFLSCIAVCNGQKKATMYAENIGEWYEGSIMLANGNEIQGLIKFNENTGVLSYESGSVSKSFTPKNVAGFEFFDDALNKQKVFYSLEYIDPQTDVPRKLFFEVIKEFKSFAVLSKVDPIIIEQKINSGNSLRMPAGASNGTAFAAPEVSQTETIYFMSDKGKIDPYLQIIEKEREGSLFDKRKTKNKFIKDELLEQYTGSYFNRLNDFAKDNDLSLKRKKDLIRILEYYEELIAH